MKAPARYIQSLRIVNAQRLLAAGGHFFVVAPR